MYPCSFALSPSEGHFGGFEFGEIMNKVATKILVQVSYTHTFSSAWDKHPGEQLLGHTIRPHLAL